MSDLNRFNASSRQECRQLHAHTPKCQAPKFQRLLTQQMGRQHGIEGNRGSVYTIFIKEGGVEVRVMSIFFDLPVFEHNGKGVYDRIHRELRARIQAAMSQWDVICFALRR